MEPEPGSPDPSADFGVKVLRGQRVLSSGKGYWKISARLKPFIVVHIAIEGTTYRITLHPQSVLSHPDSRLFEKALWREALLTNPPPHFEDPVAGDDDVPTDPEHPEDLRGSRQDEPETP